MRELHAKHKQERGYLQAIANEMPGAFKKSQIAGHLRKLGLTLQVPILTSVPCLWAK